MDLEKILFKLRHRDVERLFAVIEFVTQYETEQLPPDYVNGAIIYQFHLGLEQCW